MLGRREVSPFKPPSAVTLHVHISFDSHAFSNHVPEKSFRRTKKSCFVSESRTTSYGMRKTNSQLTVIPPEMFRLKPEESRDMNSILPVYSNFLEGVLW